MSTIPRHQMEVFGANSHNSNNGKPRKKHRSKSNVPAPRNPKLVKECVEEEKKSPSTFLAEMSLTTQEKLKGILGMNQIRQP